MVLSRLRKALLIAAVIVFFLNSDALSAGLQEYGRAIVIDPFNREFNLMSLDVYEMYMRSIIYSLERAGYVVDYYKDENVTIELFKKIDDEGYDVIYINSHGFIDSQGLFALFVREKLNSENALLYQGDIAENLIGYLEEGNLAGYLYVTPKFFLRYGNDTRFPGTVIFVDACYSGNNTSLAEVFLILGANCFIGWDKSVNVIHGIMMDGLFFHEACRHNKTIEEAIRKTRKDPESGASLVYFGDGSIRIQRVALNEEIEGLSFNVIVGVIIALIISASIIYAIIRWLKRIVAEKIMRGTDAACQVPPL